MKLLKRCTIIGIIFVSAIGSLSHFLYDWSGQNHLVGLFTPVNESIWEHMKLLFFPMLLYSIIMILKCKQQYPYVTLYDVCRSKNTITSFLVRLKSIKSG